MTAPAVGPGRHGWLKHIVSGLETDPHVQYKVHLHAVQFWLLSMCLVVGIFFGDQAFWLKVSVLYLVLISLYANLATDYGSMSASMAAFGPGNALPVIPLDTSVTAHYDQQAQIQALIQRNNELTETIATQTCLLEEIHRHVSALAPQAGEFPPGNAAPAGT